MSRNRREARVGLVAAVAVLLAACATSPYGGAEGNVQMPRRGGEFRIMAERDLDTLDPLYATTIQERAVLAQMYDTLIGEDQRLDLVPDLASTWRYSDPTTLVLTLRRGVSFQDGTPFDAGAVKFNLERYLRTPDSPRRDDLSSVSAISVDGPDQVTLHLKHPDAALLPNLAGEAGMMVSPTAIARAPSETNFASNPIGAGTGPFRYYDWRRGDHLIMLANSTYWGQRPHARQVTYQPNPNLRSQYDSLRNGFQDIARSIGRDLVPEAERDPAVSVSWQPGTEYTGIELNNATAPFDRVTNRQAVAAAVDRRALVDRVLLGIDTPAFGVIAPRSWAYDPSLASAAPRAPPSKPAGLTFTLKTDTVDQDLRIAQQLQSQLRAAGITMRIQPEDPTTILQELVTHRFEAALVDVAGGVDPDRAMYKQFHTGGAFNYGQFSDSAVDADLDGARATSDQARRKALYDEAQRRLIAAAGFVPLTFPPAFDVHDWQVHDYAMYPNGVWRLSTVWLS
jgi:peptide/nickel transport system substrate-binding protein